MKAWIKKTAGFGIASFFSDFSHEMTISLIPVIVGQFVGPSLAPLFLGIIASITDAFASFLRLISGFVSDRLAHKKPLIAVGYAFSAVFSTLVGFTYSVWQVIACRVLSFTGSGLREPPRDALIAATIEKEYYGRAFGLKSALDTLGSLVGPLVAFFSASFFSVKEIFLLSLIPGILAVFAIMFLTHDIQVPPVNKPFLSAFRSSIALLPGSFIVFIIIMFIFDLGNLNKLLLLARTQEILSVSGFAIAQLLVLLYAIFNLTRACCEFLIGLLGDYLNRFVLLALLGCGPLIGVALLLIPAHASLLACIVAFMASAVSTATMTTLKKASAADILPEQIRGFGFGILQASEGFAALIASALIGFLWTHYSPLLGFSYVMVMSATALVLLLLFTNFLHTPKKTT